MAIFRFSNAVSDAKKIISTYKTIYNELSKAESFGHDDARDALVKNSLVSSSGAIGEEAIRRSVRDDRSRDPLYNQAKMYGEMFRMLGWYKPAQNRLNFRFTEIASYIADADEKTEKKIFEFNVYSITSPSPLVEIKGGNVLRPLPLILKLATLLDGYISRDEIILAVLTCLNDKTPDATVVKPLAKEEDPLAVVFFPIAKVLKLVAFVESPKATEYGPDAKVAPPTARELEPFAILLPIANDFCPLPPDARPK